jgi:hypothetical protein
VVVSGCGEGSAEPVSVPGATEQLLTLADLQRYKVDSPARALLAWWRASQYADLSSFNSAFSARVRQALERSPTEAKILGWFSGAIRASRPKVLSTELRGRQAVVYTRIIVRQPVGMKRFVVLTAPQAFTLTREQGHWLLADGSYLQAMLPDRLRRLVPT